MLCHKYLSWLAKLSTWTLEHLGLVLAPFFSYCFKTVTETGVMHHFRGSVYRYWCLVHSGQFCLEFKLKHPTSVTFSDQLSHNNSILQTQKYSHNEN